MIGIKEENKLQLFKNEEFGEIRVLSINSEPYFVGKEVAKTLIYKEPHKAIVNHVDEDDRIKYPIVDELGRKQEMWIINESGLYSLIMGSKLPNAKKFKRWVTHEVLPSIRQTGGYIAGEEEMTEDELVMRAMQVMQNKLKRLEDRTEKLQAENSMQFQLIGELKPKADYTDKILQNKALVTTTAIAKDYGMSGKSLNKKLHELGIQYKQSGQWFLYSKYQDNGYTHSETIDLTHRDGSNFVKMTTKWTQKGRLFLYNKLKDNGIVPVIEQ